MVLRILFTQIGISCCFYFLSAFISNNENNGIAKANPLHRSHTISAHFNAIANPEFIRRSHEKIPVKFENKYIEVSSKLAKQNKLESLKQNFSKQVKRESLSHVFQRKTAQITVLGKFTHQSKYRLDFNKASKPDFAKKWSNYSGYYVKVAKKINGNHFSIPKERWNKMNKTERWRENRKFLDQAILRGDRIRLSSRLSRATPGSAYAMEIAYLRSKGYFSVNSRGMPDPKGKWMKK